MTHPILPLFSNSYPSLAPAPVTAVSVELAHSSAPLSMASLVFSCLSLVAVFFNIVGLLVPYAHHHPVHWQYMAECWEGGIGSCLVVGSVQLS